MTAFKMPQTRRRKLAAIAESLRCDGWPAVAKLALA